MIPHIYHHLKNKELQIRLVYHLPILLGTYLRLVKLTKAFYIFLVEFNREYHSNHLKERQECLNYYQANKFCL
jgi:hypothetical protein